MAAWWSRNHLKRHLNASAVYFHTAALLRFIPHWSAVEDWNWPEVVEGWLRKRRLSLENLNMPTCAYPVCCPIVPKELHSYGTLWGEKQKSLKSSPSLPSGCCDPWSSRGVWGSSLQQITMERGLSPPPQRSSLGEVCPVTWLAVDIRPHESINKG